MFLGCSPSASAPEQPPSVTAAESGAASRKGRGRPPLPDKAPRKSRAKIPRLAPSYVDMGGLSLRRPVRYDAGQQRYDVRDLLELAFPSKKGHATKRRMTKVRSKEPFKEGGGDFGVVKWLDDPDANLNKGGERETATAPAAARMLRDCAHQTGAPMANALAYWLEQNGPETLQFLPETGGEQEGV